MQSFMWLAPVIGIPDARHSVHDDHSIASSNVPTSPPVSLFLNTKCFMCAAFFFASSRSVINTCLNLESSSFYLYSIYIPVNDVAFENYSER